LNSVPTSQAPALNWAALTSSYEELRRQFLNGHRGAGLAVFMRRGMWEWMHVCSVCNSTLSIKVCSRTEAEPMIPQGLQTEIVLILAGMLLHCFQEART
jgi:hypothetical protein